MHHRWTRVVAVVGFVVALGAAIPATAQAQGAGSSAVSRPEFGVAYSFVRIVETNLPRGFDVNFTAPVNAQARVDLRVLADFSLNNSGAQSSGTTEFILGGVQIGGHSRSGLRVFGQAAAGLSHWPAGEKQFTLDFGGGVEVPIGESRVNLLAQVDFPYVFFNEVNYTGVRLNVGVAIPLGR